MEFVYEGDCPCICDEGWDVTEMTRLRTRRHTFGDPSIDDYDVSPVGWICTVIWPVDPVDPTDEASYLLTEQVKAWAWLKANAPCPA